MVLVTMKKMERERAEKMKKKMEQEKADNDKSDKVRILIHSLLNLL